MDSIELLRRYTKHKNVAIVSRGNEAISEALKMIKRITSKKKVLIPDQGGWLTYEKYIAQNELEAVKLRTDRGIINLGILNSNIAGAAALLITSFAGYYAEQPLAEIAKICKQNQCLLIEDASGAVGDARLCNGLVSDIIVGSFGEGKVVDNGTYGFISTNFNLRIENIQEALTDTRLLNKLKAAPERLRKLLKLSENVKFDLQDYEIFHRNRRGINVITEFNDKIIEYCNRKGYEYVICPKSIKINENAISIELKRLNFS